MALPSHVALLRGVNVGGKNKLPMSELAALLEGLGCAAVRTYIQSGNAAFRAPAALARRLPAALSASLAERHGLRVPVVVRGAAELRRVAEGNPYLAAGADPKADPKTLHVAFLADEPSPERIASLDPARSPPDELVVRGRDVYLRLPNGAGRTKLTNEYLDARLGTVSTVRNWNTVLALLELTG